ncbi:hypothetical protein PVAND_005251 [Polypedilum vanderplanki]|uniref:Pacifastin domain-containing protein n=1 Tax=Polypedilum vanderplanki TaxID=319348 RepID=A0A9J6C0H0_POLVA|nr:hypothetical protein PVAND_005251 [Polypedilum vanderplanki]
MKFIFALTLILLSVFVCESIHYDEKMDVYLQNCIPGESFINGCGNRCRCGSPGIAACTKRACVSAELREEFVKRLENEKN